MSMINIESHQELVRYLLEQGLITNLRETPLQKSLRRRF